MSECLFFILFSSHPSYTSPAARWSCDQGGRRAVWGPGGSVPAPPHQRGGRRSGRAPLQHHPGRRYRHQVRRTHQFILYCFCCSTHAYTRLTSHSTHTHRYANCWCPPSRAPIDAFMVLEIKLNISCSPEFSMESMKIDLWVCKRLEIFKKTCAWKLTATLLWSLFSEVFCRVHWGTKSSTFADSTWENKAAEKETRSITGLFKDAASCLHVVLSLPLLTFFTSSRHQAWVLQTHRVIRRIHHVPRPAFSAGEGTQAAVPGACAQGRCWQAFGETSTPNASFMFILQMCFKVWLWLSKHYFSLT